jgi:anti-sigma-K factor RskA
MRDHERIEELMAARALGGLDASDEEALRREMADHGAGCAECRRLEDGYAETAGRLAFALDPVPVRDGLEEEVLARARTAAPEAQATGERSGARSWLRPLVAVAASVVLFAAGWAAGSLSGDDDPATEGARVVAFEGEAAGNLAVAFRPDGSGMFLLGSGLEAPPEGKVYEVWMFQEGTPVSATCFTPSAEGTVFTFVDVELGPAEAMAVTVEPASCPGAPTTAPILTADVVA